MYSFHRLVPAYRILQILLFCFPLYAQAQKEKSYNSLLWEITGNGLQKPSYLFGTMHISNKMVFNLSDSFYMAIRNADVVAIELNPDQWQSELPRMNKQGDIYKYYNAVYYTDYLKENSFTGKDFLPSLQMSLRFEPALNDALLYRNESRMDNFQEDTYLDLYIYQTGKKLGKQTTGVETYMGSQRMMMEALVDAATQKDKKRREQESPAYYRLSQDLQDAYRRGDLDMLDSINKITEYAESFTEKFLYRRNEMQAASMDSIMRLHSLFVGVGAAHLPGKRGVIEILRKKGYTLRPVFMADRDAAQKRYIDSLTVPVHFTRQYAADSFFSVSVPGRLNEVAHQGLMLRHYADMGNGSYYLVTRIPTDALFNGYSESRILRIVDSLLYENIPGTIISKKATSRNSYSGLDIVNKTRKGDLQHYQLYVTPAELLVFKMGGKGNYVQGKEAEEFFGSIAFREREAALWPVYQPPGGGFSVQLPATPRLLYTPAGNDNLPEWRYEAEDPANGDRYAIIRKSIYSFDFIEADTFDLMLMQESFGSYAQWEDEKTVTRSSVNGRPVRDMAFRAKNGDYIASRAIMFGPQYYLLVHRSRQKDKRAAEFFRSFAFAPFRYPPSKSFTDTSLHFTVSSSVQPVIDSDVMDMVMYVKRSQQQLLQKEQGYQDNPPVDFANFVSEETGEVIVVNSYHYPEYGYIKDSARFFDELLRSDSSLVLKRKVKVARDKGVAGWMTEWSDTASTRVIRKLYLQKGMYLVTATTMADTLLPSSSFVRDFYASLDLEGVPGEPGIFTPKQERFFKDYYSKDTTVSRKAKTALPSVYYGKAGYPLIWKALQQLRPADKDYYELKTKFIDELGYIRDSTLGDEVARTLRQQYLDAGDTTVFQNSILRALANLRTAEATAIFKELVLQDPPAFESGYEYASLFSAYQDSLKLAVLLYPEIMNLSTIEDYKTPVRSLLASLIDSSCLKAEVYDDYIGNIFFDAKIAWKKSQYVAESQRGQRSDEDTDYNTADVLRGEGSGRTELDLYTRLLAPYYDKNPNISKFFDKLLATGSPGVKMAAACSLLRYGHSVPPGTWKELASDRETRVDLWTELKRQKQTALMPPAFRTPQAIAEGWISAVAGRSLDTLSLLDKRELRYKGRKLTAFVYRYKQEDSDAWKLAICGIALSGNKEPESDYGFYLLSDKKLGNRDVSEAADEALRRFLIGQSSSGREFFRDGDDSTSAYSAGVYPD